MIELLRFYFKCLGWFLRWAIVVWFVLIPCLMLFGVFKPWQQAREALQAEGIGGIPLVIGSSGSTHLGLDGMLQKTQQRSYIVVPDSFRSMNIFTYEVTETNMGFPSERIMRVPILPLLLILYLGAGIHTFFVFRRIMRRHRARMVQEG